MDFTSLIYSLINILNEMSPYILLGFLIAGLLHVFVRQDVLLKHLSGNDFKTVVKAAAIGVPLPLCSCGVLPTAVSLRRQGASKAATTSFLIATPQTGVDSIAATYSLLGLPFAIARPIAALVCAVLGGTVVGKLCADNIEKAKAKTEERREKMPLHRKMYAAVRYGFVDMIDSVGKWLVIGLVIAALITVFVPDSLFVGLREVPLVAMLIVVLIAIPMYICATGSIPIAMSLMLKGLTPGVAFVLLMAGPAANFASMVILNRTLGRRATAIYVASVVVVAIGFGLIIDYCLPAQWFVPQQVSTGEHCHLHLGWFDTTCSALLVLLLGGCAWRTLARKRNVKQNIKSKGMTKEFKITGMNCMHCRATAEKAISEVPGVETVSVDLGSGIAVVTGEADDGKIKEAVRNAGFDVKEQ